MWELHILSHLFNISALFTQTGSCSGSLMRLQRKLRLISMFLLAGFPCVSLRPQWEELGHKEKMQAREMWMQFNIIDMHPETVGSVNTWNAAAAILFHVVISQSFYYHLQHPSCLTQQT